MGCCGCCGDDDGDEADGRVLDYSYKPYRWQPKGNYLAEPLLGLELEVIGSPRSICDAVAVANERSDTGEHLYCKHDSSIPGPGAEIVSHPMTLAWARDFKFPALLRDLRGSGCYAEAEQCGLHIHVSRNAFRGTAGKRSVTHPLIWLHFLYRNQDSLEKLARRTAEEWGAFKKTRPPGEGYYVRSELARKAAGEETGDRYVAVNCNNERTMEMRFFASTVDETEFWAALEFADASVNYTRTLQACDVLRNRGLQFDTFAEWVDDHNYPNLMSEIERIS